MLYMYIYIQHYDYLNFQYDTSHFPGFEELRPFLRANYGFQMAFIKALDGYEWLSWLVQDISPSHEGHGTKFVLKVGGIEKDRNVATEVQWRQAMMKQLTNHGIVCPEVLPTTSGTLHCFYKDDNGGKRNVVGGISSSISIIQYGLVPLSDAYMHRESNHHWFR